jgi:hypothetical protein
MVWLLTYASFDQLAWGLGSLILGIPFYVLQTYKQNKLSYKEL